MVARTDAPIMGRPYQVRGGTTRPGAPPASRHLDRPYHRGMSPRSAAAVSARAFRAILVVALFAALAGCAGASFDPSGPCTVDGRAPGSYPELEAVVRTTFRGEAPDRLDSGRNCTPQALATLVAHGVSAMRFAGATWDLGSSSGVTLAVFEAPALEPAWLAEFYEVGARAGRNVESVETKTVAIPDGRPGTRIDALNGESYQSVVVWSDGEHVRVALIASFIREVETKEAHDAVVDEALGAAIAP
jgi:hypothetical protein